MTKEALKLAELIEQFDSNDESLPLELLKPIAATLRALAQPEQEPVTWAVYEADGTHHNKPCQYPKCSYPCPDLPDCRDAQPEQEPVAWRTFDGEGGYDYRTYEENEQYAQKWEQLNPKHKDWVEPLYTTPPPQRKPLTDEEIERACVPLGAAMLSFTEVARAIEAAHGIKE